MSKPAIIVNGLSKVYPLGPENTQSGFWRRTARASVDRLRGRPVKRTSKTHWALKDVSFTVNHGERIGIIGRNGAGKSTLLKVISRVVYPTAGEVRIRGRLTSLLEVGTGFNDNLSGRDNVFLNAALYGLRKTEIEQRFDDIVAFSEVARFIDTPVKNYSSGMKVRLAFAVAAHLDPDILLLDEVLAVGDLAFQQKCLTRVQDMTSHDRTLLFVSHSPAAIRQFCNRCIWLQDGQILMDGSADEVVEQYSEETLKGNSSAVFVRKSLAEQPRGDATITSAELEPWAALRTVRALDQNGQCKTSFTSDEHIEIEVEYEIFENKPVYPNFRLYQNHVLVATIAYWQNDFPTTLGVYRSKAVVPPYLLNLGEVLVSVGLNTPVSSRLHRHDVAEHALKLFLHETTKRPTPAGPYPGLPGSVRLFFQWTTEAVKPSQDASSEVENAAATAADETHDAQPPQKKRSGLS